VENPTATHSSGATTRQGLLRIVKRHTTAGEPCKAVRIDFGWLHHNVANQPMAKGSCEPGWFDGLDCAQVGRAIEQLRTERSLTIEQVATKTDLSAEQLARIEDGERDPTWTAFYRIAVALDTTATLLSYAIEVEPPSRAEPSD